MSDHEADLDPDTMDRLREHHREDDLIYRDGELKFHPGSAGGQR